MEKTMRRLRATGLGVTAMVLMAANVAASPQPTAVHDRPLAAIDVAERSVLEKRIEELAVRAANRKPYFDDDPLPIHIHARFDVAAETLVMDTDERLGPESGVASVEEMEADVQEAIWFLLKDIPGFTGLDWRFGGKDMYFWFPQDRHPLQSARSDSSLRVLIPDHAARAKRETEREPPTVRTPR